MAIFGLWRSENEPRVNLLVGLESSKFTSGNILAGTFNLRGLDLTQMVMDIWRPGSTVFLRSCRFYWYPWELCGSTGSPTYMHNYELDQRNPRPIEDLYTFLLKVFDIFQFRFVASRGKKWPSHRKQKWTRFLKEFFCLLLRWVILSLCRLKKAKNWFSKLTESVIFPFYGLHGQKMTKSDKIQKYPLKNRVQFCL